jgi:multisubunit Na+/H+ antiporter MnhB subunit
VSRETPTAPDRSVTRRVRGDRPIRVGPTRILALILSLTVAFVLIQAVLDVTEEPNGLAREASENLAESGVSHPVTAVLLNFRAYDTFLEVGVLLLAALGVLAVRREHDLSASRVMAYSRLHDDPVLALLVRLLAPLLVLAGGYLLWLGSFAPGGAFQAGAMLAAAGVTIRMAGHPSVAAFQEGTLRRLLLFGFVVFLLVALGAVMLGENMLELPVTGAGLIILAVEAAVTLSIGVTLVALFVGAQPLPEPLDDADRDPESQR